MKNTDLVTSMERNCQRGLRKKALILACLPFHQRNWKFQRKDVKTVLSRTDDRYIMGTAGKPRQRHIQLVRTGNNAQNRLCCTQTQMDKAIISTSGLCASAFLRAVPLTGKAIAGGGL